MSASLYSGFPGIAWATAHLRRCEFPPAMDYDLEEIDAALLRLLLLPEWTGHYDLIGGLAGIACYAAERLPGDVAAECLRHVVRHLERNAIRSSAGTAWRTPPHLLPPHQKAGFPDGVYNLGAAHGIPSAILALGIAAAAGVEAGRARELALDAVHWLRRHERTGSESGRLPDWVLPSGIPAQRSNLAWCYGDPGSASLLFLAARLIGDEATRLWALDLATGSAEREPDPSEEFLDTCICHGAAGLALINLRLYHFTSDPRFERGAERWGRQILRLRRPGEGTAGFPFRMVGGWESRRGLLEGAAGVGLTLLSLVRAVLPQWDSFLGLSSPLLPAAPECSTRR